MFNHHYNVALISESASVSFEQLAPVAAALAKQVARDFAPLWKRTCGVTAFKDRRLVPVGYWPVTIKDNIDAPGAAGYHTDDTHQPYALVQYDAGFSVTCSHELLEMICDPFGNRLHAGVILGKRVMLLEEMCDPCEAFTYAIDGISVSDFLVPDYFTAAPRANHSYSFLGKLTAAYQVADGGYISWIDPVDMHWWQLTNFGQVQISDLGPSQAMTAGFKSLREAVDHQSAKLHPKLGKKKLLHNSFIGPF